MGGEGGGGGSASTEAAPSILYSNSRERSGMVAAIPPYSLGKQFSDEQVHSRQYQFINNINYLEKSHFFTLQYFFCQNIKIRIPIGILVRKCDAVKYEKIVCIEVALLPFSMHNLYCETRTARNFARAEAFIIFIQ
jgi:hypothetical protein